MDNLPAEIIAVIFEHLDVQSRKNFILVCKRFLYIVRWNPKLTGKGLKVQPMEFRYDVDFMNTMLQKRPSLNHLKMEMNTCLHTKVAKFLKNLKFENCETLECVDVETDDMTRYFYPRRYHHIKGK